MNVRSWTSPKTQKGLPSKIAGKGFFAVDDVKAGEILAVKAGHIIDKDTLLKNQAIIKDSELQITDDLWIAPLSDDEFEDSMVYFNHSCEPSAHLAGTIIVVASRDIKSGEEITVDYGAYFSDPDFRLDCNCKTSSCRKVITGNDWKDPHFRQNNKGKFAWYIQRRIDQQGIL